MATDPAPERHGEYADRGDYHRHLDEHWDYRPTYLAKMAIVRRHLESLPGQARVLDAGCGEGLLVKEFANRLQIEGVDTNYSSAFAREGSVTALPYADRTFDEVLCLDVLEHLTFPEQPLAFAELFRVFLVMIWLRKPAAESLEGGPERPALPGRHSS